MTTRGEINSNFYQIVNVDSNGNPTDVKPEYLPAVATANYANFAGTAFNVSGSNVSGTVANATYAVTSGTSYSVDGANVSGTVANATYATTSGSATTAGTVTTASQPNITSTGTLTGLTSTGIIDFTGTSNVSVGAVGNLHITGGTSGYVLSTDGSGTLSWVAQSGGGGGNGTPGGSNTQVQYNDAGTFGGSGSFTFNNVSNTLTVTNIVANGSQLTNLTGANVSGTVANANYSAYAGNATVANSANSVTVANVSGIGNIATINLDGNVSNILHGNGYWGPETSTGNANYAAYAGNVTINAQSNITSLGNLINLQFDTTVTPFTAATGQMFWDTGERTVTLGMLNGVQQQVGLEQYILVKASSTITNGQVVMFTGANGDNVTAAPANSSSVGFKTEYIIGIATQDIATNDFGYITTFGQVHGLNTNAYTVGDILWYDPTSTTGGLTNTQPIDPNYQIQMAAVTKKAGGDGHIQVRITVFNPITRASDVEITTPTTGQALIYNGSNVWINGNPNVANYAGSANTAATVTTNAQPNITSLGTLTTLAVSNNVTATRFTSNIATGTAPFTVTSTTTVANLSVANSTYANTSGTAGTVTTNAQPNITSFGTLTGLTSNGTVNFANSTNVSLGGVATVHITGGTNGYVLQTDGSGNLSWTAQTGGGGGNIAGSNTQVQYNNAGSFGASAAFTFNSATNTVSSTNITATANITSGNASLGNAATANYFIGTLYGTANSAGNATTAGTVTTNAQPNITSTGTLTSLTVSGTTRSNTAFRGNVISDILGGTNTLYLGYIPGYGNVSGDAAFQKNVYVGLNGTSTLTVINDANVTNNLLVGNTMTATYLYGDGSNLTNLSGGSTLINGNSNVIVSSNANITMSVSGNANIVTVTGTGVNVAGYLNATGNITGGNASLGNLASATYLGGTLTTAAQPNITSLGTLSNLVVSNGAGGYSNIYGNGTISVSQVTTTDIAATGNITASLNVQANSQFVSTVATGTAPFVVTSTTQVANLNVATSGSATTAGTVTTNAQPNITSTGTLTSLSVTGNITAGNVTGANLMSANYVTGTLTTAAQPNITSTGTLTSVTVTGNASVGNISSTGLGNVANVLFTKYNETVVAGGSTGAATLTPNAAAGTIYNYTLTGNITLSALSNAVAGTSMVIILTQDATGNRLLTSTMKFAGGSKTLSTAANAIDIMSVFYDGSTYYATLSKGYA